MVAERRLVLQGKFPDHILAEGLRARYERFIDILERGNGQVDPFRAAREIIQHYCTTRWEVARHHIALMLASEGQAEKLLEAIPSGVQPIEYLYGVRKPPYAEAVEKCLKQLYAVVLELSQARGTHPLCAMLYTYPLSVAWEELVLKPLYPLDVGLPFVRHRAFVSVVYAKLFRILADDARRQYESFYRDVSSMMFV